MPSPIASSKAHRYGAAIVAFQSLLLLACSKSEPPPRVASAPEPPLAQAPAAPPEAAYIVVSTSVREKCDVPDTSSEAPQFDFDDASLRPRGMGILDQVAHCMREGSLKGQPVTIIGHTDPRGSEDYNRKLGLLRAQAARDYLATKGVSAEVIGVKSRGEQDAAGQQPGAWQLDRRVEIQEISEVAP